MLTMIKWWRMRSSYATVSTPSPAAALSQLTEGQVGSEDHGAAFVTLRQHLEEQVGLFAAHRQVSYIRPLKTGIQVFGPDGKSARFRLISFAASKGLSVLAQSLLHELQPLGDFTD